VWVNFYLFIVSHIWNSSVLQFFVILKSRIYAIEGLENLLWHKKKLKSNPTSCNYFKSYNFIFSIEKQLNRSLTKENVDINFLLQKFTVLTLHFSCSTQKRTFSTKNWPLILVLHERTRGKQKCIVMDIPHFQFPRLLISGGRLRLMKASKFGREAGKSLSFSDFCVENCFGDRLFGLDEHWIRDWVVCFLLFVAS
jgi:hypothetical protein